MEACEKYSLDKDLLYLQVTKEAVMQVGTTSNLKEGDILTLNDLFYAMMLPSGNDAAYVIAENIGAIYYFARKGDDK